MADSFDSWLERTRDALRDTEYVQPDWPQEEGFSMVQFVNDVDYLEKLQDEGVPIELTDNGYRLGDFR